MEEKKDSVYRWYELDRYDKDVPEGEKGQIQSNLEETFSAILDSLRGMAQELGIEGFEKITIEKALEVCQEQKESLGDYLNKIFKQFIDNPTPETKNRILSYRKSKIEAENASAKKDKLTREDRLKGEKRKLSTEEIERRIEKAANEEITIGMAELAESYMDPNLPPQVKAYVQAYLDSFADYGPGARDNVVTAMVISGGVQHEGEENVPYSTNALYGCGFGKTGVSKGVAMGKLSINKRSVITSSTPELAGQSFDELLEGFAKRNMAVVYVSEGKIKFLPRDSEIEIDKDGKEKIITETLTDPEEIRIAIEHADVVVSDLTALIRAKEEGLFKPDRDRDSLLQDEQDSDMFHNLWSVEIKGKEYSDAEHALRISARKRADALVKSFIYNNPDKVVGNKVKQSVSIDGRPPEIEIEGKSVKFEGISITVPDGIESIEFAEFIMDSLLAQGLYTDKGKDYVVKDGKIEPISPSTGGRNDIPEGVIQALAIKEGIEVIQNERKVEKVVSKMTFLKEMFAEISGMSATYGMDPKQFLEVVSKMGLSPDLIEVEQLEKKTKLPSFKNLTEEERKPTICKKSAEKIEDLEVTIGKEGNKRTVKCSSPQMAAIVRDIEAHKNEAIIIGTDNREKTIEIVIELSRIYGPDKVEGYSSVPEDKGYPKLLEPPNPADGKKLPIALGKIVVGDHCIGRGITPAKSEEEEKSPEHLIMAQMPSRSEGLLEQFLGRVGRKKGNGSVSFVLQEDDDILEEYRKLNEGKEPEDILKVIDSVYPEKTKDAMEATKGDIELGRKAATEKDEVINFILGLHDIEKIEDLELHEDKNNILKQIEGAIKYFDKAIALTSKQYKGQEDVEFEVRKIVQEYLENEKELEMSEKNVKTKDNKSEEIESISVDSRYSQIKSIYDRSVELSKLMSRDDKDVQQQHEEEDERG